MKKILKYIFKRPYNVYQDVYNRLYNIETALDCLIEKPLWVDEPETGFNEQQFRKQIFIELVASIKFTAIIETGTWIGNTTGYMSRQSNLPLYTGELDKRYFALAKMRLKNFSNIFFTNDDSRNFLSGLDIDTANGTYFFYLDAHWYDDLPLKEELAIICNRFKSFVIMIDDFKVPDDAGYGYDNFGRETNLSLEKFEKQFRALNLKMYFPAVRSDMETGKKRGCIILSNTKELEGTLNKTGTLKKYD